MPIQFNCPQCNSPIEVDDEFAEQMATCPYCQAIVHAPPQTTLARPAAAADMDDPQAAASSGGAVHLPSLPGSPAGAARVQHPDQVRRARSWGNYALALTILALLCLGVEMVAIISVVLHEVPGIGTSQPSPESIERMQKVLDEALGRRSWLMALHWGFLLFAVTSVILAAASLSRARTWQGVIALTIGGLLLCCQCGGILVSLAMAAGG